MGTGETDAGGRDSATPAGKFLLEDSKVFQQRDDADNDDDDLNNLPHAGFYRQALNEVKH
jgi:hypothetical protein